MSARRLIRWTVDLDVPAAGLAAPVVVAGRAFRLDLAYPELMLTIEYNGRAHLTPDRADEDLVREQLIVAAGWRVIRFRAAVVLGSPSTVAATVAGERRARGAAA